MEMLKRRLRRSQRDKAVIAAGCVSLQLLLTACAGTAPGHSNEVPVRKTEERVAAPYAPARHEAVDTITSIWQLTGGSVKIVLCEPQRMGASPLVVYLPGLGEPSEAGERWRMAWASGGYAVLSVQPLIEDATAWNSELARAGDFKALGRWRYAPAEMSRRVAALGEALTQARHRAAAGERGLQHIDWNRVVVAGFDLGAYTAMAVAGEHVAGTAAVEQVGGLTIRAALAISPYVSASADALDTRYLGIRIPVLSVTSDSDGDPLGLANGTSWRSAPFERMRGPDKYLLSLQGLPHAHLSGNALPASQWVADTRSQGTAPSKSGGAGQRGRGGRRQAAEAGGSGEREERRAGGAGDDGGLSVAALQMRMRAAQDITTAFLDAHVKDDPQARSWLAAGASQWLGAAGELRRK